MPRAHMHAVPTISPQCLCTTRLQQDLAAQLCFFLVATSAFLKRLVLFSSTVCEIDAKTHLAAALSV